MHEKSVRKRIFITNTVMVLTVLVIFFGVTFFAFKVYSEATEEHVKNSVSQEVTVDKLSDLEKAFQENRKDYILLFLADGAVCIVFLLGLTQFFTHYLLKDITKPLDALTDAAERVRKGDLTVPVAYSGYKEFETVCDSFNGMQTSILKERKKNEAYERARTDMVAGISHDLRTPLTVVRGTVKGLMDGISADPATQKKFLDTAYRRTGEMDRLIQQLFYFSRLETGNMPLQIERVDLRAFLLSFAESRMKDSTAAISCELPDEELFAMVDAEQMLRVLNNLVENSVKYAEADPLRIQIRAEKENGSIGIEVRDNGSGIAEDKLPFVFDEFFRGDESRNRKEGNGLGLYIVRCLISAMGGTVSARNDHGFTVCIRLPASSGGPDHKDEAD